MAHRSVSTSSTTSDATKSSADSNPAPLFAHESPPQTASTRLSASSTADSRPSSPPPSHPPQSPAERSARDVLGRLPGLARLLESLDDAAERAGVLYDLSYDYRAEYLAWMYEHPEDIDGVAALRRPREGGCGGGEGSWLERRMRGMDRREMKVLERGQRELFRDWDGWGEERRVGGGEGGRGGGWAEGGGGAGRGGGLDGNGDGGAAGGADVDADVDAVGGVEEGGRGSGTRWWRVRGEGGKGGYGSSSGVRWRGEAHWRTAAE
ncbi:hypothetical protein LTR91_009513 [Friedmanniomyces endolithicus]|uniref:Uncharacterized protein n=1 Tax=Friedmanniomyces endolithicus TaxID=329885 RepID=A0AAN6QTK5_9PEZI|nr:hypothetical protein LTR57_001992 [Friedmanniomyces endolithicus]KAK0966938.1 hypothetical protein LTS01_017490 [Friedmanniomyces endolithicus]KAK0988627.1 hypothetical protein LTR91_009513 [Friedmanniomyces endolithicus]KAK1022345.1 hypothetical protein LTS16_025797 [Friedmanniomyces endolithicus]